MLDVVYNHFGPEGNYLHVYAPEFFTDKHHTPWGAAINFDSPGSRNVRDFYIHNTLYWLEEYHFDGLRFDAVHAIIDDSEPQMGQPNIMTEIARRHTTAPGANASSFSCWKRSKPREISRPTRRHRYLRCAVERRRASLPAHVAHRRTDGYYEDYVENPYAMLCRCLAEGFGYQGQASAHLGAPRGEPSGHLPPTAFVNFLQNHDQIGNRAFGERINAIARSEEALRAGYAVLLLALSPPMLFMGEEWEAPQPFPYFCDFEPDLAAKVREGRKSEFSRFEKFSDKGGLSALPDPTALETFRSARLDWSVLQQGNHADIRDRFQRLLAIRQRDIVPLIPKIHSGTCIKLEANGAFAVDWRLDDGSILHLLANLTDHAVPVIGRVAGRMIFSTHPKSARR